MEALRLIVELTHTKFNTIIVFWTYPSSFSLSKAMFWRLDSPSALGQKNLLSWAQSVELFLTPEHQNKYKAGYIKTRGRIMSKK
jgi:hypothetical protein